MIARRWWLKLPIAFMGLIALYMASMVLVVRSVRAFEPPAILQLAAFVLAALLGIAVYRGFVRLLEKRSASELSGSGLASFLLLGIVTGFALFAIVIVLLIASGHARVRNPDSGVFPVLGFGTSIVAAVYEELIMRGALFRIIEERFGSLIALIVSASIFGLLHVFNPGANFVSTACIALEAGLLLATAFMATRSLWFPIGLHFGWNFTEGGIFGAAVSGGKVQGFLSTAITGPPLVSGGEFGPEASVVALAVCLVAASVFLAIAIRQGYWRSLWNPA